MKRPNVFCVNSKEMGCCWGKLSNWDELVKDKEIIFIGKLTDYNGKVYVAFHTDAINYIIEINEQENEPAPSANDTSSKK